MYDFIPPDAIFGLMNREKINDPKAFHTLDVFTKTRQWEWSWHIPVFLQGRQIHIVLWGSFWWLDWWAVEKTYGLLKVFFLGARRRKISLISLDVFFRYFDSLSAPKNAGSWMENFCEIMKIFSKVLLSLKAYHFIKQRGGFAIFPSSSFLPP